MYEIPKSNTKTNILSAYQTLLRQSSNKKQQKPKVSLINIYTHYFLHSPLHFHSQYPQQMIIENWA